MSFVPKKIVNEDVEVLNECHINQAAEAGSNSHNSDAVSCCLSTVYFNIIYKTVPKISVILNFCKNFKKMDVHMKCVTRFRKTYMIYTSSFSTFMTLKIY